jgi:diamine N-acetyltransferase
MTSVTLHPITSDNFAECIGLSPSAQQKTRSYVAENVVSIAQAYAEPWWIPLAVYAGETMVGFVMYGRWPQRAYSEMWRDRPKPGIDYICRMMIDERYQGQGYGKAALAEMIERIKAQGSCRAIELDYDRDNVAAGRLYTGFGFQPVEENDDGEILARLEITGHAGPRRFD